jgi:hypothetical protein
MKRLENKAKLKHLKKLKTFLCQSKCVFFEYNYQKFKQQNKSICEIKETHALQR